MLPRKKQKLEQTAEATSSDGRGQYASGNQDSLLLFHDTAQKECTPEPSGTACWQQERFQGLKSLPSDSVRCLTGNLETDLTEVAVLQRRKRHLQGLCDVYQVMP